MSVRHKLKSLYFKVFGPPTKFMPPPYRHIVQLGDPILRFKSEPVPVSDIHSKENIQIMRIMWDCLDMFDIAGISAPQIGVAKRIMAIQYPEQRDSAYTAKEYEDMEMEAVPKSFWINPEMKILDWNKVSHPEGCASLKGLYAHVPRYKKVLLKGLNEDGNPIELEAKGWTARIIQHEMDHLEGTFYTDLMEPKSLCHCGWQYINLMQGRVKLDYGPV